VGDFTCVEDLIADGLLPDPTVRALSDVLIEIPDGIADSPRVPERVGDAF
jgi:hypothetical protein